MTERGAHEHQDSSRDEPDASAKSHRLWREFDAPAGLFDPARGEWLAVAGAPGWAFPPGLPAGGSAGAVSLRRSDSEAEAGSGLVWLTFPDADGSAPVVAAVGFADGAPRERGAGAGVVRWGPPCPDAALIAWGRCVFDRQRRASERVGGETFHGRDRDREVVARLIQRLKVSDAPERFQKLAANALRAATGVRGVVWVPGDPAEPVVVSGEVGLRKGREILGLIPGARRDRDAVHVENRARVPGDAGLKSVLAVRGEARGVSGWLVAVDPPDGRPFDEEDVAFTRPIAALVAAQQANARVYGDLKDLLFGVVRALTAAVDAKDPYTSGHSERVARIAVRIAEELGMPPNRRGDLYLMGLLHDVGKIGVDDAVLKKAGPLTPDEYRRVQAHVEIGVNILAGLKTLSHLLPGVRLHHESLDGTGYPSGLSGEDIPLEARILAAADAFDAMSSTRPYRRRLTPSRIDEVLKNGSGHQWDPRVVDALFACRLDLERIRQKGLGESLQAAVSDTLGRR